MCVLFGLSENELLTNYGLFERTLYRILAVTRGLAIMGASTPAITILDTRTAARIILVIPATLIITIMEIMQMATVLEITRRATTIVTMGLAMEKANTTAV